MNPVVDARVSTPPAHSVVVRVADASVQARRRAARVARCLGLAVVEEELRSGLSLEQDHDGGWGLRDNRTHNARLLRADFSRIPGGLDRGGRRAQPIARAIGTRTRTVVDATAGLGADAWLLACLGYRVMAVERCAVLALLLKDAARRRRGMPLPARISVPRILYGESAVVLGLIDDLPDAVYIDTMFPRTRGGRALQRRGMVLLRELVGEDDDADGLLRHALGVARERVVVKRALRAPTLDPKPAFSITGTTVRYDVYPVRAGPGFAGREAGA